MADMTYDQAISVLDQVSSKFQGTRDDHILLVKALEMFRAIVKEKNACTNLPDDFVEESGLPEKD